MKTVNNILFKRNMYHLKSLERERCCDDNGRLQRNLTSIISDFLYFLKLLILIQTTIKPIYKQLKKKSGKLASLNVVTPLTTLSASGSNQHCWADSALQGQRSNQYAMHWDAYFQTFPFYLFFFINVPLVTIKPIASRVEGVKQKGRMVRSPTVSLW